MARCCTKALGIVDPRHASAWPWHWGTCSSLGRMASAAPDQGIMALHAVKMNR